MKTIVALVDLTDASSQVLDQAQKLAAAFSSRVILLHVVPLEPVVGSLGAEVPAIPLPSSRELVHQDKVRLEKFLSSLTAQGTEASALQFEGPVAETVITETEKLGADLIIMGSHHHSALYNLFVGSVTADILKRARFPVLVLPTVVTEQEKTPVRKALSAEEIPQDPAILQPVLSV